MKTALTAGRGQRQLDTTELAAVSWDYRSRSGRELRAASSIDSAAAAMLIAIDDPGPYAWQTSEQGARMLANQRAALDACAKRFIAGGTVRSAAPGTRLELSDHAEHEFDAPERRPRSGDLGHPCGPQQPL